MANLSLSLAYTKNYCNIRFVVIKTNWHLRINQHFIQLYYTIRLRPIGWPLKDIRGQPSLAVCASCLDFSMIITLIYFATKSGGNMVGDMFCQNVLLRLFRFFLMFIIFSNWSLSIKSSSWIVLIHYIDFSLDRIFFSESTSISFRWRKLATIASGEERNRRNL